MNILDGSDCAKVPIFVGDEVVTSASFVVKVANIFQVRQGQSILRFIIKILPWLGKHCANRTTSSSCIIGARRLRRMSLWLRTFQSRRNQLSNNSP
jgi:hypothetical protein